MPQANRFRHQAYHSGPPISPYRLLPSGAPANPSSPEFNARIAAAGTEFGQANVTRVYLVHGTGAGNDVLGLLTELSRWAPRLAARLQGGVNRLLNAVLGETGNYTRRYAARLESGLTQGAGRPLPVRLFDWPGQNSHIARADGAIRLLDELARQAEGLPVGQLSAADPPRVQLWGHSHGGNIFALITNLLGADAATRAEFFAAARPFYRAWPSDRVDMPTWPHVERLLGVADHPLRRVALDMVTFGTPIRYGWDTGGYAKLLHVVNHRPWPGRPTHLAAYPPRPDHVLRALGGDYMHQLGIAGSGFPPIPLAVRTYMANRRLRRLLRRGIGGGWLHTHLSHGTRVADESLTLLVNYDDPEWNPVRHLLGHAAYTRSRWLPLHCELVAEEFYAARPAAR